MGAAAVAHGVGCGAPGPRWSDLPQSPPDAAAPTYSTSPDIAEGELLALLRVYLEDPKMRDEALRWSLSSVDNPYVQSRLRNYNEDRWGALPVWDPKAVPIEEEDLDVAGPTPARRTRARSLLAATSVDGGPSPSGPPDDDTWSEASLLDLGRRAFFSYPMQLAALARGALRNAADADSCGLLPADSKPGFGRGGLVWTELPGGEIESAFTCSSCHAARRDGATFPGKNNPSLSVECLSSLTYGGAGLGSAAGHGGLVDVTDDGVQNPTAIPDLRPTAYQHDLQRTATVRNGLLPLALRTETLIITSLHEAVRPPRVVAFALAAYLWRLRSTLANSEVAAPRSDRERAGERWFGAKCAGCHAPPSYAGQPVPLTAVQTDPRVGESPERATGFYRVPSLRGVGDRSPLLASGSVRDVREMLDPARTAVGHPFGLDLEPPQREELLAFLLTL